MGVQEQMGEIDVHDDVFITIATKVALEVEGVVGVGGGSGGGFLSDISASKGPKRGVTLHKDSSKELEAIDMYVQVRYGVNVYQTAHQLQRAVKNAVETMTGHQLKQVNVNVNSLVMVEAVPGAPAKPIAGQSERDTA
jgi:uncharacterized alkaline shock family protein YloU